ncbi:hypothetical protein ACFY3E_42060 [Streptomyces griseorubiginosus]|uniref:hypothetical protein n=1 Tax=Streptomyces griseorubiginosus TaxID=67304 RepID=UPI00369512C9
MSSQHRDPALTIRPPADLRQAVTGQLNERNLEVQAFVVACFNALMADPDGFLGDLSEHWPDKKPRGRPRKADQARTHPDQKAPQEPR